LQEKFYPNITWLSITGTDGRVTHAGR